MKRGYQLKPLTNILLYLIITFLDVTKVEGQVSVYTYIRDTYTRKATPVHLYVVIPQGVEELWVAVQTCKFPTVICGCLFRHLKTLSCTFDYITDVLKSVILKGKDFYILGDLNDNFLMNSSKVNQIIANAKLRQLITKPRRATSSSARLLD